MLLSLVMTLPLNNNPPPLSNLYISMLQRLGINADRFGSSTGTLAGLEMIERGIARDGYKVLDGVGRELGYVTSGSYAPFFKKNIALAYVAPEFSALGNILWVEIRGRGVQARVVTTPFYKRPRTV